MQSLLQELLITLSLLRTKKMINNIMYRTVFKNNLNKKSFMIQERRVANYICSEKDWLQPNLFLKTHDIVRRINDFV